MNARAAFGLRAAAARAYAWFAFGPAAAIYELLTDEPAWRRDCRDLGALVGGPRVLDLGIGPGTAAVEMAGADPARRHVGLDVSPEMLRRAARRARGAGVALALVRGDALRLPFRTGALDAVTGHSFLYLLPDAAAALAEIRRVLRPGGRVALVEPRAGAAAALPAFREGLRHGVAMVLWRGMSRLHRRFDEARLEAVLARAGFEEARAWTVLSGFGVMATARGRRVDVADADP